MTRTGGRAMMFVCAATAGLCVSAWAGAGDGIRIGDGALLVPYAEGNYIYDDNVLVTQDNEENDTALMGKVGLDLTGRSEQAELTVNAWASTTDYQDLPDQDHDDFSLNALLGLGTRDQVMFGVSGGYEDIQGVEYSTSAIEHRRTSHAGVDMGKDLTDKTDGDVSYQFIDSKYGAEEPSRDWQQNKATLEIAHQISDKSAALVNGSFGTQSSDSNENDADFYEVQAGLKTKNTEKVTARGSVGYRTQNLDPIDPNDDDTISGVAFQIAGDWQLSDRVALLVSGQNGIYPSRQYDENYAWETGIKAGLQWKVGTTVTADIEGHFRQWDLDKPVIDPADQVVKTRTVDTVTGILRLTYQTPAKFLAVYAEGQYEDASSTFVDDDYQQMLAIAGVRLCY